MMNGRNNGKKLMAVRIVAHAFEIVRQKNISVLAARENKPANTRRSTS